MLWLGVLIRLDAAIEVNTKPQASIFYNHEQNLHGFPTHWPQAETKPALILNSSYDFSFPTFSTSLHQSCWNYLESFATLYTVPHPTPWHVQAKQKELGPKRNPRLPSESPMAMTQRWLVRLPPSMHQSDAPVISNISKTASARHPAMPKRLQIMLLNLEQTLYRQWSSTPWLPSSSWRNWSPLYRFPEGREYPFRASPQIPTTQHSLLARRKSHVRLRKHGHTSGEQWQYLPFSYRFS